MDTIIRKTKREDLPQVLELVHELADFENARSSVTADLGIYEKCLDEGIYESIVAEKDNRIVGTCIFYMTFSTWKGKMMYLEDFVVSTDQRGKGTGRLLFDRLIEISKNRGCALMKWQVLDWNENAIRFYEKYETVFDKEWWNGKIYF